MAVRLWIAMKRTGLWLSEVGRHMCWVKRQTSSSARKKLSRNSRKMVPRISTSLRSSSSMMMTRLSVLFKMMIFAVIANFRADRIVEISKAFEYADFDAFERVRFPKTKFVGLMQYDGDLKLPANYLVPPPLVKELREWLEERVENVCVLKLKSLVTSRFSGTVTALATSTKTSRRMWKFRATTCRSIKRR